MTDRRPDRLAPWPTLTERDAGIETEPELYEGVPPHLTDNLVDWVQNAMQRQDDHVRAVLSRFRVSRTVRTGQGERRELRGSLLMSIIGGKLDGIDSPRPLDQLSVLDAFIALHPHWDDDGLALREWLDKLADLRNLLADAGSAWTVDTELRGLYRRVDPTTADAWRHARTLADAAGRTAASDNLAMAWREAYGRSPDPSASYSAAVKAVEAVAVPVIAPGTGWTVHAAARRFRKTLTDWHFTLIHEPGLPAGTGSADVVSTMLDRLLVGETDRHTSDERNRVSTLPEAEAALHLAVTLVQWFAGGAVQPRTAP